MSTKRGRNPKEPWDDPQVKAYLARANKELRPMVEASRVTVALWMGEPDAKQAIELGFMVLYNKPIIILADEGVVIPPKLAAIADAIIVGKPGPETADLLKAAMTRIVGIVVEDADEN